MLVCLPLAKPWYVSVCIPFRIFPWHVHSYTCIDFNSTFRAGWIAFLPNPGGLIPTYERLSEIYEPLIGTFLDHLIDSDTLRDFSTPGFVRSIITAITNAIGNAYVASLGLNDTIRNCVVQQLNSSVDNTAYSKMASRLETLREGMTSFINFEQFHRNYVQNSDFNFPSNCIDRLVYISFCDQCKKEIPPLCSNTCGALIRGCYSPYYDALPKQFNILWDVSRQVLDIVNSTIYALFTESQRVFDESLVVSILFILHKNYQGMCTAVPPKLYGKAW